MESRSTSMFAKREPLTFWQHVAATALGTLITAAVCGLVLELRLRFEVAALEQHAARFEAESQRDFERMLSDLNTATVMPREQVRQMQERYDYEREDYRLPAANSSIKVGDLACLSGSVVRRLENGWEQFTRGTRVFKCRTTSL